MSLVFLRSTVLALLCPVVFSVCNSKEHISTSQAAVLQANLQHAVDIDNKISTQQLQCLSDHNYRCIFVRVFDPTGNGSFDSNALATLEAAYNADLASEVYIIPQPFSPIPLTSQFQTVYDTLRSKGIKINRIWIKVQGSDNWSTNTTMNTVQIMSIINRAASFNVICGIFTNHGDWSDITANSDSLPSNVLLWYNKCCGTQDFSDFKKFGNWKTPSVKQYAPNEELNGCNIMVNKDILDPSLNVGQNNFVRIHKQ